MTIRRGKKDEPKAAERPKQEITDLEPDDREKDDVRGGFTRIDGESKGTRHPPEIEGP